MTRAQAVAEAERRQRADARVSWIVVSDGEGWAVASIGVQARAWEPTAAALEPPPPGPREPVQSELQRVTNLYG